MKLGFLLGYSGKHIHMPIELIQQAESMGYDSVWTAEAYGNDAVTSAAYVLAQTSKIRVGTAIMQMPARTPAMCAMTAMSLDQLSGGRFIVGLGASAPSYYPAVGDLLGCRMILPEHAGVANAIGAVVGRVTMRKAGTISSPSTGVFRVHFDTGPEDFIESDKAIDALEQRLRDETYADAVQSGAEDIHLHVNKDIKTAEIEGDRVFVEATLVVEASGRPRIADG